MSQRYLVSKGDPENINTVNIIQTEQFLPVSMGINIYILMNISHMHAYNTAENERS